MADEKKKDSFTFSDKIKNSKPVLNPFAKRASSKIGSNGKPKKTIFDRTRRDVPFFIAAAAALLFLPFLYKYSGSVIEEPIVAPGADSVYDPLREGIMPSLEDPNGHISQLTGRDSLSLIRPWGADDVENNMQDGLDDNVPSYPTASSSSRPNYPDNDYRKNAPAVARAAFKRAPAKPTAIKEMGRTSMNMRGGGGLPFRFGGANLKNAAKRDVSGGPKKGAKPVSLQPLRAAGNPSRSYFGQSGAAQARASRDAMGKANAAEALRDAMFKPVETGRLGGLSDGAWTGGGGPGKWDNKMDYKGITPWWWDMMKDREQKKWEWKYFLWRKNLVEPLIKALAEVLGEFGKGFACCLITGADDCGMGTMWGSGTEGTSSGCKINKKVYTTVEDVKEVCPSGNPSGDLKKWCTSDAAKACGAVEWVEGKPGGNLNFFQVRGNCMGATVKSAGGATLKDRHACQGIEKGGKDFDLQAGGKASGWKKYIIVTAKNYALDNTSDFLCARSCRNVTSMGAAGSAKSSTDTVKDTKAKNQNTQSGYSCTDSDLINGLTHDNDNDSCVIYIAEADGPFSWTNFRAQMREALKGAYGSKDDAGADALFNKLHLSFIQGFAMKEPLAENNYDWGLAFVPWKKQVQKTTNGKKLNGMPVELPMRYEDFMAEYVIREGSYTQPRTASRNNKAYLNGLGKTRKDVIGQEGDARCDFASFRITAIAIDDPNILKADLQFDPKVHGENSGGITVTLDIPEAGLTNVPVKRIKISPDTAVATYATTSDEEAKISLLTDEQKQAIANALATAPDYRITAKWKATFQGKVSQDEVWISHETVISDLPEVSPCEEGDMKNAGSDKDGCVLVKKCVRGSDGRMNWGDPEKADPNCPREEKPECTEDKHWNDGQCDWTLKCQGGKFVFPPTKDDPSCGGPVAQCTEDKELYTDAQGCVWILPCVNGQYGEQRKKDPNCGRVPPAQKVGFYDTIKAIPQNADLTNAAKRQNPSSNTGTQYNSCSIGIDSVKLLAVDSDIEKLLRDAKEKYDAANRSGDKSTLEYKAADVTVANLLDAMALVNTNIPLNAVCMLGKTIGAASRDPHWKMSGEKYPSNIFGTFLAFIGNDSSFYPGAQMTFDGETTPQTDLRFRGCPANARTPIDYHYGNYNWNGNRTRYEGVLSRGVWAEFPLAPIAGAVSFTKPTATNDRKNRQAYHSAYKNVLEGKVSCGLSGNKGMSYEEVKKYITTLCSNGLELKPGNGWNRCGHQGSGDSNSFEDVPEV